jgi:hypothetical protein
MDFNLLTDSWIEAMDANARIAVYSPLALLSKANDLRSIAMASPLDLFAVYRFLLTLLYWKANAAGGVTRVRESLLAGAIPQPVLHAVESEKQCFSLFDQTTPFLQDPSASQEKRKSAGSLFAEFACGTNVALFHHGDDRNMRLCVECAALGLLRVIPWTQSGGAGLSPSIHNAPPLVVLACGERLAATLGLNFFPLSGPPGKVRWSGHFVPTASGGPIPYLEALTWNPRRILLGAPEESGTCWRCGKDAAALVGPIVYSKNEETKSNKKGKENIPFAWKDPAAFYEADTPYVTVKSGNEMDAASGMDARRAFGEGNTTISSAVVEANRAHLGWRLIIPCTNPANNKTFDHRQLFLSAICSSAVDAVLPHKAPPIAEPGIDGWSSPTAGKRGGSFGFVRAAKQLLTASDWAALAAAAHRPMHDSPEAFDILAGLFWSLRRRKVRGLPSRNVAWLVLKLMASVPSRARDCCEDGCYCPLNKLPKRQPRPRRGDSVRSPYPVAFPRGDLLEAVLRDAILKHLKTRSPGPIDWSGLCDRLNQLTD